MKTKIKTTTETNAGAYKDTPQPVRAYSDTPLQPKTKSITLKTKIMKKMKNLAAMCLIAVGTMTMNGQNVSISATGTPPDPAAMLHVDGTTGLSSGNQKGVLIPTVALTDASVAAPVGPTPLPQSLVVYNTNTSMANGNGPGFYYWNGSKWVYLAAPANGPGSAGQVLTSQGANNPPQWSTLSVSGGGGTTGCANCITAISSPTSNVTWVQCADYCNSMGGGWRMPTWDEAIYYRTSMNITSPPGGWQANYIWTSTPWDARVAGTPSGGGWVVFYESNGAWGTSNYTNTFNCRCVR